VLAALGKGIVVGVREVAGRGAFIALLNPLVGLITHSRIPCLFQRPGVALHAQCEQDGPLDRLHHFIGNTAQQSVSLTGFIYRPDLVRDCKAKWTVNAMVSRVEWANFIQCLA